VGTFARGCTHDFANFLSWVGVDLRTHQSQRSLGIALAALVVLSGCRGTGPGSLSGSGQASSATDRSVGPESGGSDWFVDRAKAAGLDFSYFNGMSGQFYFPEMLGGGVGLLDYDNDGDLDVYFAQGQMLGAGKTTDQATIPPHSMPLRGRLYRNDLTIQPDGTRVLHFTDVTEQSGINARDYGMGVATGDFNNDGCVDLYLTNFGPNRLYRNNCDGTFTDVTPSSGMNDPGWSVSAAFVDYDRDGWLDLYVGHYVQYKLEADKRCTGLTGRRDYCTPAVYTAGTDRLYHNEHNGTFVDVTAKALPGGPFGPALGVSTADFNGDGWPDIYVANDGKENLLWINQRDGTFKNMGLLSGAALSVDGRAKGSMGVDAGDFDNDGDEDLYMTQLPTEGSELYVNDGSGFFEDRSGPARLGPLSMGYTGFGAGWFDFDNDGWLDLLMANGSIEAQKGRLNETFPYDERNLLFRNLRDGRFEDVSAQAGAAFRLSEVSRGAAFGDIDNDGDVDVVISNVHGPARLLINNVGSQHHWVGLRAIGCATVPPLVGQTVRRVPPASRGSSSAVLPCRPGRDMVGAKVQIVRQTGPALWRRVRADGSYASANDPRIIAGLGESTEAPTVRVSWPNGDIEEWLHVAIDRWTVLTQGEGHAP
jgi:enediyne biosynthesis protein E4